MKPTQGMVLAPRSRNVGNLSSEARVEDALGTIWSIKVVNHNGNPKALRRALLLRPPVGVLSDNTYQNDVRQLLGPNHGELTDQLAACETNFALMAHFDLFVLLLEDGIPVNPTLFKLATTCNVVWQGQFDFNNWCAAHCDARKQKEFQDLGLLR